MGHRRFLFLTFQDGAKHKLTIECLHKNTIDQCKKYATYSGRNLRKVVYREVYLINQDKFEVLYEK